MKINKPEKKVLLSTLWIFAMFNYLYADIVSLMDSENLKMVMSGVVGNITITQGFLLGAAILMETAIVMIVLSRVLNYKANRITNIAAGILHTLAVLLSMGVGDSPAPYYIFFGTIEVCCTLYIIWLAWTWKEVLPVKNEGTLEPGGEV